MVEKNKKLGWKRR